MNETVTEWVIWSIEHMDIVQTIAWDWERWMRTQ